MLRPLPLLPVELRVGAAAVVDPGQSGQHGRGRGGAAYSKAVGEIDPSGCFILHTLKQSSKTRR